MKRIFAAILVIIVVFSGCGGRNRSLGVSEEIITDTDIVRIRTSEVSSEKIAIEIINESKNEIGYDEFYFIEFDKNGEWHRLEPKFEESFIEVAYVLEKESACTWGDSISRIYGKLPEGKYRLIKYFTVYEGINDPAEKITLAAQFIIG